MNIFLGSIYPKQLLDELTKRKLYADYPADVFQHSLLRGLDEQINDLHVVTSPVIKSSYSEIKDICNGYEFSHREDGNKTDIYVGTCPISGLQMLVELWIVIRTIFKLIGKEKLNVLFIYALHSPFLLAAVLLRNKLNCTCVIVPDLPEFMSKQNNPIKKVGKRVDRAIINFCLKRIDSFVLLSPFMRDRLPIENKPWVLMEGIFNTRAIPRNVTKSKERVILYAGNLSRKYGIIELLEAFTSIGKENYQLWICGRGDAEKDVKQLTEKDKRIKFFGVVSHDDVLKMQQQATVLINPRSSKGEYTKYSFPSKTMEYLASGTPTVMCHLPAIPAEYDKYIYYITEETAEGIKNKLLEVCEKPQEERDFFGKEAADFIKNQKNAKIQSAKIIKMINCFRKMER